MIAKLANGTPISLWFIVPITYNQSIPGVDKQTYNVNGGPTLWDIAGMSPSTYWTLTGKYGVK